MDVKVVTLGEILVRLSPPDHQKILQANHLDIHVGGAEANVAVALSNLGVGCRVISRLPENDLAQLAINRLRSLGVDTDFIVRGGDRIGIYFLETGSWARASKVIYDRTDSAICHAGIDEFDLEKIFDGAKWFHTSGITPAVSDQAADLTLDIVKYARNNGLTTSFDINFRQKLWNKDKARTWLSKICELTDVYIGNTGHASLLMDVDASDPDNYDDVFAALKQRFGFKYMACTIRKPYSASRNEFGAVVSDGKEIYKTRSYDVSITDRVGTGDSFSAGLIYGLMNGQSLHAAAEFGVAAAALKHTIPGDLNYLTADEIKALMEGDGTGNVRR